MGSNNTDTAQQTAIYANVADGRGHTLIIARAGTGKTTTIERALGYVPSEARCLFLAFNKSVADELKRRVTRTNVMISTCHSFGLHAIRQTVGVVDVDSDLTFKQTARFGGTKSDRYQLAKAIALAKDLLLENVDEVLDACDEVGIDVGAWPERFARHVVDVLRSTSNVGDAVDFCDMVWLPLVDENIEVPQFDHVFVDEVQDLNRGQLALITRACKPGGRITAIGDDRQAIYQFRGIDADVVGNLRKTLTPVELPLTTSFRCAGNIIKEAQRFVPDIMARPNAPAGAVERDVPLTRCLDEVEYGDFILSRVNAPLVRIALRLLATDCRVSITGKKELSSGLKTLVYKLRAATPEHLVINARAWLAKEERRMLAKDPPNEHGAQLARDKFECLEALAASSRTVDDLLRRVDVLFAPTQPNNCVTLSSTHRAKGLERDKVWVLADTYLRAGRAGLSQEEKNLYYVAVTRARNTLMLVRGLPGAP